MLPNFPLSTAAAPATPAAAAAAAAAEPLGAAGPTPAPGDGAPQCLVDPAG